MGCNEGSATIEFPADRIDAELKILLEEDYGVEFKKHPFGPGPLVLMQENWGDMEARIEAGIFTYHDSSACYGQFEDLENLLIFKGIPFDRDTNQDWQIDPGTRIFRPGDPPLDLWLDDFPGHVGDALHRLIKAAKAVIPSFTHGNGTPARRKEQGCVPRLYDPEALELEAAIKQADEIFPTYPPLSDYVKAEAA